MKIVRRAAAHPADRKAFAGQQGKTIVIQQFRRTGLCSGFLKKNLRKGNFFRRFHMENQIRLNGISRQGKPERFGRTLFRRFDLRVMQSSDFFPAVDIMGIFNITGVWRFPGCEPAHGVIRSRFEGKILNGRHPRGGISPER